jgi:hypothetical protein
MRLKEGREPGMWHAGSAAAKALALVAACRPLDGSLLRACRVLEGPRNRSLCPEGEVAVALAELSSVNH